MTQLIDPRKFTEATGLLRSFFLEKGFLDFISHRKNLKKNINHYIDLIQNNTLRNYI